MKNLMFNFTSNLASIRRKLLKTTHIEERSAHTRLVVIKRAYFFANTPYNKGCKDIGITKSYTELCK